MSVYFYAHYTETIAPILMKFDMTITNNIVGMFTMKIGRYFS